MGCFAKSAAGLGIKLSTKRDNMMYAVCRNPAGNQAIG
jgi:hypothetical protein